jgi:hypothetical protein
MKHGYRIERAMFGYTGTPQFMLCSKEKSQTVKQIKKKGNPFPLAFFLSHQYNTLLPLLPASLDRPANNSH